MPKLKIDGVDVEVPQGTNVLEAAKQVGIVIPHFCYHPALGSVGACRLCAMNFLEGPVKGVQVSCMIQAADGMVVSTTDPEAARLRRMVIEWLMLNHPHDCPVCDEGGMCLLQDYTIAGGHGRRRYKGKKRTYNDQYLGEFIYQEMNRCIQCYRCSRFYQDYSGGEDFGPMQIANKVFFGRFREGWLESEFHGNLAEVCPTGVFTDKTYRYKARPWELETAPSVCPHCSLGCNVIPGAKLRKLLRIAARENPAVNGWFICDRGRFGYRYAGRQDRPRKAMIDGKETDFYSAIDAASKMLADAKAKKGAGAAAFLGSVRASLETDYMVARLAESMGSGNVCYSSDPAREAKDRRAAANLVNGMGRSLRGVEQSDLIVVAGADPINEAPMLALMMRQAWRSGARIMAIDPRPLKLPFEFKHIPTHPDSIADRLSEALKSELGDSKKPLIVAGTDIADIGVIDRAAEEAKNLRADGVDCGLFYTMSGPNSFGAALLAGDGPDFDRVLGGILAGDIRALVVVESDPLGRYPDGPRAEKAFSMLDALVVMDYLPTETAKKAHVFLPSSAIPEQDGIFINQEGRAQAFGMAYVPGIPVNDMGPKLHPPRAFFSDVPGRSLESWRWLQELGRMADGR
ncbi:MAG: NADH-quinone oxidoreductase subunit NuoG, partial [Nitrospirota bacterium]